MNISEFSAAMENLVFNQSYSPLAGSFWFERMKADHLQDIVEEARMVANR